MPRAEIELAKTEMTSMIDIIFQLLIYFMVTLALGVSQKRANERTSGKQAQAMQSLPKVPKLAEIPEKFEGYLIQIARADKGQYKGQFISYILDEKVPSIEDADKDSLHNNGPWLLQVGKRKLQKIVEDEIFLGGGKKPILSIRAAEDTEFGDLLDILEFCDADSIEQVVFRFSRDD